MPDQPQSHFEASRAALEKDVAANAIRQLDEYLALFPGDDEAIARAYLARSSTTQAPRDAEHIGPYHLIKELGRGGQGIVWLAEDTRLNRKVALKVLTGLGPGAESHLARFQREATLASKLDHPGICGVHDTGIADAVPFIAMRYVKGETLADKLARLRSSNTVGESLSFVSVEDAVTPASPAMASAATQVTSIDRTELDRIISAFEKVAAALAKDLAGAAKIADLRDSSQRHPEKAGPMNELAWMLVVPEGDPALRDPKEAVRLRSRRWSSRSRQITPCSIRSRWPASRTAASMRRWKCRRNSWR